jgi:hypothetical protein
MYVNSAEQQHSAANALFVSDVQPSECPGRHIVERAIIAMLLCYGGDTCTAEVAAQFGDHPEAAARRMTWVLSQLHRIATRDSRYAANQASAGPVSAPLSAD